MNCYENTQVLLILHKFVIHTGIKNYYKNQITIFKTLLLLGHTKGFS